MKSCFTCVFNNESEDTCDENLQYFYAEFGKDCSKYKSNLRSEKKI